jgi:hypothetical protein
MAPRESNRNPAERSDFHPPLKNMLLAGSTEDR